MKRANGWQDSCDRSRVKRDPAAKGTEERLEPNAGAHGAA